MRARAKPPNARRRSWRPEEPSCQLGKQLGQVAGRDLSDDSAQRGGVALPRTLGMSYGMAASLLVGRGVRPLWAGLAMGVAAFVVVDEGT